MIADQRPALIVEVGGGYSTLVAREALTHFGVKARLVVIDPQPRTDVEHAADTIVKRRIEQFDIDAIDWADHCIFFIDSSHICRVRGDVALLYCKLVPLLPRGTIVHVHDVYLPWDYPCVYDEWFWSEQYLLHCLLSHNTRYQILLATHFLARTELALMRRVFGEWIGTEQGSSGCSFWLRVREPA